MTVLTLDYSGFGARARVMDLLSGPEVVPLLGNVPADALSSVDYAEALLSEVRCTRPVNAVVAYCMASPIAHELARMVTAPNRRPPTLVSLDGSPCPAEFVRQSYRELLTRYGGDDQASRVSAGDDDLADRPVDVLAAMSAELTEVVTVTLARDGGEPDEAVRATTADLVGTSVKWMAHLVAAHNAVFTPWPGEVVLVVSQENPFSAPWPGARSTRMVHVNCPRAELLDHPATRRAVVEAIAGR